MTRSKRLRVLREVWESLPTIECKGLCWNCCSTAPIFPLELEVLQEHAGHELPTTDLSYASGRVVGLGKFQEPCPFLVMNRCSAREVRPTICRIYGMSEGIRCPHGCKPTRLMTDDETFKLLNRVEVL